MLPSCKGISPHGQRFVSTKWSVVAACAVDDARGQAALEDLCRDYWGPLHSYLRWYRHNAQDAEELTQSFFAWLLESKAYAKADPAKGRFRTFLLALLKHFISGERERKSRQKRGGDRQFVSLEMIEGDLQGQIDHATLASAPDDADRQFDREWARALVEQALSALAGEYSERGKEAHFRILEPYLRGGLELPSQPEAAERMGVPLETFRSHLSRLRGHYRAVLRAEVSRTVRMDEEVDEELRYLSRVILGTL